MVCLFFFFSSFWALLGNVLFDLFSNGFFSGFLGLFLRFALLFGRLFDCLGCLDVFFQDLLSFVFLEFV